MEKALHAADTPIDRFFFDAFGGALPDAAPYAGEAFADLRGRLSGYAPRAARDHAYWRGAPCSMLIDEVEKIRNTIDTRVEWRPFDEGPEEDTAAPQQFMPTMSGLFRLTQNNYT